MKTLIVALLLCMLPVVVSAQVVGGKSPIDPPFMHGNYGINTTTAAVTFGFISANSDTLNRYWPYTYVILSSANAGNVTVKWILNGTVLRQLILSPGASVADYVACDSLNFTKGVAADTIQYGAFYNE